MLFTNALRHVDKLTLRLVLKHVDENNTTLYDMSLHIKKKTVTSRHQDYRDIKSATLKNIQIRHWNTKCETLPPVFLGNCCVQNDLRVKPF